MDDSVSLGEPAATPSAGETTRSGPFASDPGEPILHGGDLTAAARRFPQAPTPWIDLSTGINPFAYPVPALAPEAWQRLPEGAALQALRSAASRFYGAADPARIVAAPGTQALIQILPRLRPVRHVAILGFGYQEHPRAWMRAGARVSVVDDVAALIRSEPDVVVVVNPNNPDGRLVSAASLRDLAATLALRGAMLVVDEAFHDLLPRSESLAPDLPDNAIVLRSFGKTFGLAGLRLGFAIAQPCEAERIAAMLGPWAVSGPAMAIGTTALSDAAWVERMIAETGRQAQRLDALLAARGLTMVGGTSLFRLHAHPDAPAMFERLGRAGILVRPFPARPDWLRFGLPSNEEAWRRLDAALAG